MKLPEKMPADMAEAKMMLKDFADQVVAKVTEVCNKMGKKPDVAPSAGAKKAAPDEKK